MANRNQTSPALSAIDLILNTIIEDTIQPGEFTADMAYDRAKAKGKATTKEAIRHILRREVEKNNPSLTVRKARIGGRLMSLYKAT